VSLGDRLGPVELLRGFSLSGMKFVINGAKAVEGLHPSFSSRVRFGERGAPVRFLHRSGGDQAYTADLSTTLRFGRDEKFVASGLSYFS
jgi:hypothetical protein